MKAELDSIVNMERVELDVVRYNQRRSAVFAGISRSEIIQNDMDEYIHYFRESRKEKWWDGGEFMALEKEKSLQKERISSSGLVQK